MNGNHTLSANYATNNNQTEAEKARIEAEVHRLVTSRDKKYTNFIEYNNYKLIYRRYAGLFFTIAVDVQDNELSYLESIHLFVELLDSYFANVCELDIVFNFNKVYRELNLSWTLPFPNADNLIVAIKIPVFIPSPRCLSPPPPRLYDTVLLDEYMLAGEIEETSKREILDRVKYLEKLD
jgi:AP-2 complex subunit sigma-1